MKQLIQKLGSFPYYVFGITLFFLTHGYSENVGLITLSQMFLFFAVVAIISFFLLFLFKMKFRSFIKAGIIVGLILFFYLFYGALQESLKNSFFLFQLSRYRALLPGIIILIFIIFFFIKRSSKNYRRLTVYINTLLLVLILVDLISITRQIFKIKDIDDVKNNILIDSLSTCDRCHKPDIFLIVLDEYWGNQSLQNYFGYDNHCFTSFLEKEGFFVAVKPFSNYTSTPLSIASMFDMRYIEWLNGRKELKAEDYAKAVKAITNGVAIKFLDALGYKIKNCSIFDILNQPTRFNVGILPIQLRLITSKTLIACIERDLLWHIRVQVAPKVNWLSAYFQDKFKEGNEELLEVNAKAIVDKDSPKFVYCHLIMPHLPYLFDSTGNQNSINFYDSGSQKMKDNAYLNYLVYSNKIATGVIRKIKLETKGNAVIILMSDHGYRDFSDEKKGASANNNFNAVFLPKKNYDLFYDSISNVNQFRVLLNTLFNQHLPILKDSVVF